MLNKKEEDTFAGCPQSSLRLPSSSGYASDYTKITDISNSKYRISFRFLGWPRERRRKKSWIPSLKEIQFQQQKDSSAYLKPRKESSCSYSISIKSLKASNPR